MFVLRMPKIVKQSIVILFTLWLGFIVYNEFGRGNYFNAILFLMALLFTLYQVFKEMLLTYKKGQLLAKEVVFDEHIWGRLKNSLSFAYIILLINLIVAIFFTQTDSYNTLKDLLAFSVYMSLFGFMLAQLFQAFFHHSRE